MANGSSTPHHRRVCRLTADTARPRLGRRWACRASSPVLGEVLGPVVDVAGRVQGVVHQPAVDAAAQPEIDDRSALAQLESTTVGLELGPVADVPPEVSGFGGAAEEDEIAPRTVLAQHRREELEGQPGQLGIRRHLENLLLEVVHAGLERGEQPRGATLVDGRCGVFQRLVRSDDRVAVGARARRGPPRRRRAGGCRSRRRRRPDRRCRTARRWSRPGPRRPRHAVLRPAQPGSGPASGW